MEPLETKHREAKRYFMPSLMRFLQKDESDSKAMVARRRALLRLVLRMHYQATEIDELIPGRSALSRLRGQDGGGGHTAGLPPAGGGPPSEL